MRHKKKLSSEIRLESAIGSLIIFITIGGIFSSKSYVDTYGIVTVDFL